MMTDHKMLTSFDIIIPAFNEGPNLKLVFSEIESRIRYDDDSYELFFLIDGSTDFSREILNEISIKCNKSKIKISILDSPMRLGYSKAISRCLELCTSSFICFFEADGQWLFDDIYAATRSIRTNQELEIISGERKQRSDSLFRKISSNFFKFFYRILTKNLQKDPSCPFIVIRNDLMLKVNRVYKQRMSYGFWWEWNAHLNKICNTRSYMKLNHKSRKTGKSKVYVPFKLLKLFLSHFSALFLLHQDLKASNV
jgi:glycosyltransferase involved in cell wall biosynthesis